VCVESRCCFLLSKEWGGVGLLPVFIQQPGAAITQRQNCRDNRIGTHESVAGTTQVRRRISLRHLSPVSSLVWKYACTATFGCRQKA
jgi:hypothetical protein